MSLQQIAALSKRLAVFLFLFSDCFRRSHSRDFLRVYVEGQLSNLPRKNAEAIALQSGVAPRTLQRFLESIKWDEERLRDRCQEIVLQKHSHPQAIGIIDESGVVKSGAYTAGVGRQYCGSVGKVANCAVGVHLGYSTPGFHCLLDSQLYLPEDWANDPLRRAESHVPKALEFQTKPQIALGLIRRALANGLEFKAWTFDELYGRDGAFLNGLQELQQDYVAEVPRNFYGWVQKPVVRRSPPKTSEKPKKGNSKKRKRRGRPKNYPRLLRSRPACQVCNLATYSPLFREQSWRRYHIRDTDKGPLVWEIKWAVFWRKEDEGLPTRRHCLMVARNVLTGEIKYFVANRVPGERGVTLRWLLRVAFERWAIEKSFRDGKQELGLADYQVRGWRSIHRHFFVTQLTYLFCAQIRHEYDASMAEEGRLTIDQVRSAIETCLSSADLPSRWRTERRAGELFKQHYHLRRNAEAREFHTATRIERLRELGIDVVRIRSCAPPGESVPLTVAV